MFPINWEAISHGLLESLGDFCTWIQGLLGGEVLFLDRIPYRPSLDPYFNVLLSKWQHLYLSDWNCLFGHFLFWRFRRVGFADFWHFVIVWGSFLGCWEPWWQKESLWVLSWSLMTFIHRVILFKGMIIFLGCRGQKYLLCLWIVCSRLMRSLSCRVDLKV